ncbi:HPP family protein [Acidocella sp.]|uniref:HPP family protein n=1 Tax=Acidocella sp. TaxID=50710 RepID=UPI00261B238F|nr:HPP family protein [Acidocella sp.]
MSKFRLKLFSPILAGATLNDRLIAGLGGLICIGLTGLIGELSFGGNPALPLIVAPLGASSVLLFAVPTSPLAQPWAIIGGNTISALCGILAYRLVPDMMLAAGLAVGLAIVVMSFTKCLHPPGGAAALTAVIGGPTVVSAGFAFAFVPMALNCIVLVATGWMYHRIMGHTYPHVVPPKAANTHATKDPAPILRAGFHAEDVDAALAELGETFDIDRGDLNQLLQRVERQALIRTHGHLTCADIMSRDVVTIGPEADIQTAHALLLEHDILALPVVDASGRVLGTIGVREAMSGRGQVANVMAPALTTTTDTPAFKQIEPLTDGQTHAVVILDVNGQLAGLLTQTDLLAAAARVLPAAEPVAAA